MKQILQLYIDLWNSISYFVRKGIFEMSYHSKCISYECYLMLRNSIDKDRMVSALDMVRKNGECTFYSEVSKQKLTKRELYSLKLHVYLGASPNSKKL